MAFGVFIHRVDSIYDDSPAERYQFPAQYLGRATPSIGDWILYYEPRKVANTRGYFAVAKVERIIPDPSAPGMYLALIEPGSYLDFATPVPFAGPDGPAGGTRRPERTGEDIRPGTIRGAPPVGGRLQPDRCARSR